MSIKKDLLALSEELTDERCACDVKIALYDILVPIISAVLSGIQEINEMMEYVTHREADLNARFGIEQIPSESTIRRTLKLLKPYELGLATLRLMQQNIEMGDQIAIDGKCIRSSQRYANLIGRLHILTAMDTQSGICLDQMNVSEKTNEIPVMLDLLACLAIDGRVITADAMHCQKKTCQVIRDREGDYILQVKGNQPELYEVVQTWMDASIEANDADMKQAIHEGRHGGRKEKRVTYVMPADVWPDGQQEWAGLKLFIAVDRITSVKGESRQERSYYISSLLGTADHILRAIRDHWLIESMHWHLDVSFQEEATRVQDPRTLMNLNILYKLAIALHRNYLAKLAAAGDKKAERRNVKSNMRKCSLSMTELIAVLTQNTDWVAEELAKQA